MDFIFNMICSSEYIKRKDINKKDNRLKSECNYSDPNSIENQTKEPGLSSIYGTIVAIEPVYSSDNKGEFEYFNVTIQTETLQHVHFLLTPKTYFVDCIMSKKGQKVVGFYNASLPMPLIYPPSYQIEVIALNLTGRSVKADFYNCFLISRDNQIQLQISNNTYIINQNGKPYCENISNKYMIALYSESTKSMPAITIPSVLIVLK